MTGRARWIQWIVVLILSILLLRMTLGDSMAATGSSLVKIPVLGAPPSGEPLAALDVSFVLTTAEVDGRVVYVGVSKNIEERINPDLIVEEGSLVELTLINSEDVTADLSILGYGIDTPTLVGEGAGASLIFEADEAGEFLYCSRDPCLRERGLQGRFVVRARDLRGPAVTPGLIQARR